MDNNILLGILGVIIVGILFFFLKGKKEKKTLDDPTTKDLTHSNNISNVNTNQKSNNITTKKGGIFDQTPNPLLKEKVANWTKTNSYDEDINSVNIDKILKANLDDSHNKPVVDEIKEKELEINKDEIKDKNPPQPLVFNKDHKETDIKKIKTQILLVDDSLVVRKYVGDLLKKNNYDVILKNDGWDAISYLNGTNQKPELIISDIEMPNMNGFELVQAIRKEKRYENTPILVISAHAESHLELMENEQIQGFIKKPFDDIDLISQLNYLLEN